MRLPCSAGGIAGPPEDAAGKKKPRGFAPRGSFRRSSRPFQATVSAGNRCQSLCTTGQVTPFNNSRDGRSPSLRAWLAGRSLTENEALNGSIGLLCRLGALHCLAMMSLARVAGLVSFGGMALGHVGAARGRRGGERSSGGSQCKCKGKPECRHQQRAHNSLP